jgi:hypothetical protein
MVGKLLSLDLKEHGVIVSIVHPGFMRTEMTKGVGFDQFWEVGGAVSPEEAAGTLVEWARGLGMEKSGEYWAPRGPSECYVSCLFVWEIVLTGNRRYWDSGSDHGEELAYPVATAVVDDSIEVGADQLMRGRANEDHDKLVVLFITSSATTLKSDLESNTTQEVYWFSSPHKRFFLKIKKETAAQIHLHLHSVFGFDLQCLLLIRTIIEWRPHQGTERPTHQCR